jgi:hypothetical protein
VVHSRTLTIRGACPSPVERVLHVLEQRFQQLCWHKPYVHTDLCLCKETASTVASTEVLSSLTYQVAQAPLLAKDTSIFGSVDIKGYSQLTLCYAARHKLSEPYSVTDEADVKPAEYDKFKR